MKSRFSFLPSLVLLLAVLAACSHGTEEQNRSLMAGRPGPAYIQWLEEQACLRRAGELTAIVSGSSLGWKHGSRTSLLPEDARVWFRASPALTAWGGQDSLPVAMAKGNTAERLAGLGVRGVVLTGLADTGDEWAGRSPASGLGEDSTSLSSGRLAGNDGDYASWATVLSRTGLLAGGTLLPAHTGMGPDFFLSMRAVRDYPGLYAMAEIPPEFWTVLPSLNEHDTAPLSSRRISLLTARGALPSALIQDSPSFPSAPCGWAVTGPVTGVDGVKRRWAYRWYGQPDRPVLHWDDPSGAARRVIEASLIRQVGIRHQILIGLSTGAWMGLDAVPPSSRTDIRRSLEPGISALRDLTRNAHRYGAAVFVQDALPMEQLAAVHESGADFFFDSVLSPALEVSVLEGNASAVKKSLRRAMELGIDQRSLWRSTPDGLPRHISRTLLPLIPEAWSALLTPKRSPGGIRINAPTVAAIACGVVPGTRPDAETAVSIRNAHQLMLATRAFLPGLLMLSGSDLDGGLPEGDDWPGTPPLWQLNRLPVSRQGLPSGFALYQYLPENSMDSFLRTILTARAAGGAASGSLIDVPPCGSREVLATVCSLPDGGILAFFGNFSRREATVSPQFSQWNRATERNDLISGRSVSGKSLRLPPWGWKAVLLR